MLEHYHSTAEEFHRDSFGLAKALAEKIHVDVKKPRTCRRQIYRQNAVVDDTATPEEAAEQYFRVNVTIPFLDQVIESMKERFEEGQASAVKRTMLIPSSVICEPDWKSQLKPFIDMFCDDLPSRHTLDAELEMWKQKWTRVE